MGRYHEPYSVAVINKAPARAREVNDVMLHAPMSGGISNLSPIITIPGYDALEPAFIYRGADASNAGWPAYLYGQDMVKVGTNAAASTYNVPTPWGDECVEADGVRHFQTAANQYDIVENSFIIEAIMLVNDSTNDYLFGNKSTCTASDDGWCVHTNTSQTAFYVEKNADDYQAVAGNTGDYKWAHVILFCDRHNENTKIYTNGVTETTTAFSNIHRSVDITSSEVFSVFARPDGGEDATSGTKICYMAMYLTEDDDMMDEANEDLFQVLAKQRTMQVYGVYPNTSYPDDGITAAAGGRTGFERDSDAVHEHWVDGNLKLDYVTTDHPRVVEDNSSVNGYVCEGPQTNFIMRNLEIQSGSWPQAGGAVTANQGISPDGRMNADRYREDGSTGTHYVAQITISPSDVLSCGSIYVKGMDGGLSNEACVYLSDSGFVEPSAIFFNYQTGETTGTIGNIHNYGIEDCGNGWYRPWVVREEASDTVYYFIYMTDGSQGLNYTGVNQNNCLLYGAQLEEGVSCPSSLIETGASEVTRLQDELQYGNGQIFDDEVAGIAANISVKQRVTFPPYRETFLCLLADDEIWQNSCNLVSGDSGAVISPIMYSGGVNQTSGFGGSLNIYTAGSNNRFAVKLEEDDLEMFRDGASIDTDTTATVPTFTKLQVGRTPTIWNPASCVKVSDIKILRKNTGASS